MKRLKNTVLAFAICMILPGAAKAAVNDYLILNEIGSYRIIKESIHPITKKVVKREGYTIEQGHAGVSLALIHFKADHKDTTYSAYYESDIADLGVRVQVTQHAGADSDQWLLHEIERSFRYGDYEEDMQPYRFENIDGQHFFYSGLGGGGFRWLSGNIVVDISYTDLQRTKPVPFEVVKAYLAKFPSTVAAITVDDTHNKKWIKDEMERRLWLCGKWYMQVQLEKATQDGIARDVHKHLEVFVNYREKYFKVDGKADREALSSYVYTKNHTALKAKYEDLQKWWQDNKDKDITLP